MENGHRPTRCLGPAGMDSRRRKEMSGVRAKQQAAVLCVTVSLLAMCFAEAACAKKLPRQPGYGDVLIEAVPHILHKPDFCGEACAEMFCRKLGCDISQDDVFNQSGVNPLEGRGCRTAELTDAIKKLGFDVGDVWYTVEASNADNQIAAQFDRLYDDLAAGVPTIVCMRTGDGPGAAEHSRLVLGYDSESDCVIYHEPARADGAYRRIEQGKFLELWPSKYERNRWTIIRVRLKPTIIKEVERADGFSDADYARHIMQLKDQIPDSNFTTVLQRPFVVIGDEPEVVVKRRAVRTIKWAVDKLKQDYFEKDPEQIIDIWLFKDKDSYEQNCRRIFGQVPHTPFGYFSDEHNALIMNIGTGGGTLVHEIVHPFIRANFPKCPAWFNEGLASLYEQCREKNGRIWGLTNWRLAGLQEKIQAGQLPSFEELANTTEREFYRGGGGDNYAQARYLCYYLQAKCLLAKYYHKFRTNHRQDPSGSETLKKVLGENDMEDFQRRWEEFVLGLTFP